MESIRNIYEEIIRICKETIKLCEDTSAAGMMGVFPITLAGEDMPSKKYRKENKGKQSKAMLGYAYQKSRESRKNKVQ